MYGLLRSNITNMNNQWYASTILLSHAFDNRTAFLTIHQKRFSCAARQIQSIYTFSN